MATSKRDRKFKFSGEKNFLDEVPIPHNLNKSIDEKDVTNAEALKQALELTKENADLQKSLHIDSDDVLREVLSDERIAHAETTTNKAKYLAREESKKDDVVRSSGEKNASFTKADGSFIELRSDENSFKIDREENFEKVENMPMLDDVITDESGGTFRLGKVRLSKPEQVQLTQNKQDKRKRNERILDTPAPGMSDEEFEARRSQVRRAAGGDTQPARSQEKSPENPISDVRKATAEDFYGKGNEDIKNSNKKEQIKVGDFTHVKKNEDGKYEKGAELYGGARSNLVNTAESERRKNTINSQIRVEKALEAGSSDSSFEQKKEIRSLRHEAQDAKKAYFEAYEKEMDEKNTFLGGTARRTLAWVTNKEIGKSKELTQLEKDYIEKERAMRLYRYDSLLEKTEKKGDTDAKEGYLKRINDKMSARILKDLERQRGIYNEKKEKYSSDTLRKLNEWYGNRSKVTKYALGVTAGTAIMTGVLSTGLFGGLAAAGGVAGVTTTRALRSLIGATIGAAGVRGVSSIEQARAEKASDAREKKFSQVSAYEDLLARKDEIEKKLRSQDIRDRKYALAKIGTAVILGGGTAAGLEVLDIPTTNIEEMKDALGQQARETLADVKERVGVGTPEQFDASQFEKIKPVVEYEVKTGDGAIKTAMGLKANAQSLFESGNYPSAMKDTLEKFMSMSALEVAQETGMFDPTHATQDSALMYKGDKMFFDTDGKLVLERGPEGQKALGLSNEDRFIDLMFDSNGQERGGVEFKDYRGPMIDTINPADTPQYGEFIPAVGETTARASFGYEPGDIVDGRYYYQDATTGEFLRFADKGGPETNLSSSDVSPKDVYTQDEMGTFIPAVQEQITIRMNQPEVKNVQEDLGEFIPAVGEAQPATIESVVAENISESNFAQTSTELPPQNEMVTSGIERSAYYKDLLRELRLPERTQYVLEKLAVPVDQIKAEGIYEYFPRKVFGEISVESLPNSTVGNQYRFDAPNGNTFILKRSVVGEGFNVSYRTPDGLVETPPIFTDPNGADSAYLRALAYIRDNGRQPLV